MSPRRPPHPKATPLKPLLLCAALTLAALGTTASAQTSGSVRVMPGHFCAANKCVRFSRDLQSVRMQARRGVSVEAYRLAENPVIPLAQYIEIFHLAQRQSSISGNN